MTTELLGESDSAGPLLGAARQERTKLLADLELTLDWSTLAAYFERLERQEISVNVLSTVGAGTLRAGVVGYHNRPASAQELQRMTELVDEAMREGATDGP